MRNIVIVVTIGALAVGCAESPSPSAPAAIADVNQEQRPDRARPASISNFHPADLATVRRATAPFHDPVVAAAAGYQFGEGCQQSDEGAMGIHVPNPALVRDGVIDPAQPEVLLYIPRADGTLRLVGVEYMQLVTVRNPTTNVQSPWRGPARWPSNFEVMTPTPQLFGQIFDGPMAGHTPTMPWHWDLHVWVWAHNPNGMFAHWNPTLSCG